MCGIAGIFNFRRAGHSENEQNYKLVRGAVQNLHRRGPDSCSVELLDLGRGVFGHARLAILDLSKSGAQPMKSSCGRYVIVFNGEIYNYKCLKERLLEFGFNKFIGNSDTEVFLEYIAKFGLESALSDHEGMFAFALYDNAEEELYLARDRFGEKPLFYYYNANSVYFSSVVSSFKEFQIPLNLNPMALQQVLRNSYIMGSNSVYTGVWRLSPGSYIRCKGGAVDEFSYWSHRKQVLQVRTEHSLKSLKKQLKSELETSVENALSSDLDVGTFLSGGIDSSLITCLAKKTQPKLHTFSVGFEQESYNEAPYAKEIANVIGTVHHEIIFREDMVKILIDSAVDAYDEPFADSSQLPTLLVSELAKHNVSVCLSGDGGDELFAGYNRYTSASRYHKLMLKMPNFIRRVIAESIFKEDYDRIYKLFFPFLIRFGFSKEQIRKLISLSEVKQREDLNLHLLTSGKLSWLDNRYYEGLSGGTMPLDPIELTDLEFMQVKDLESYLVDDILVKVDRASMHYSLESRAPFLNSRIFELAFSIPDEVKISKKTGKILLREILTDYLNPSLFDRKKMGFGIPLESWMKGTLLHDVTKTLSSEKFLDQKGFFGEEIYKQWISGKSNNYFGFWNAYMLGKWLERNI